MSAASTMHHKKRIAPEEGGTFRVVVGVHVGDGPPGCPCDGCHGDGKNHHYESYLAYLGRCHREKIPPDERLKFEDYRGDVIESKVDLCRRHNKGPASVKFERLDSPREAGLDTASEDQLLAALAQKRGLDLSGVQSMDDLLAKLRQSEPAPAAPKPHTRDGLRAMTAQQLRELAEAEEIDIGQLDLRTGNGKEQLIQAILAQQGH